MSTVHAERYNRIFSAVAGCIELGDFELAGGGRSSYYVELRKLTLSRHLYDVVQLLHPRLLDHRFEAVGGPEAGANQIIGAYLATFHDVSKVRGFTVRKEQKGHGLGGLVVGNLRPGDRAVLLEDVATTGGSLLHAVRVVRGFGAEVVAAVAILDRLQGATEALRLEGVPLHTLYKISDFAGPHGPVIQGGTP